MVKLFTLDYDLGGLLKETGHEKEPLTSTRHHIGLNWFYSLVWYVYESFKHCWTCPIFLEVLKLVYSLMYHQRKFYCANFWFSTEIQSKFSKHIPKKLL